VRRASPWGVDLVDNPGWLLTVDLGNMRLVDRPHERQEIHRSEHERVVTWVEGHQFHAACGPLNLGEALSMFRRWGQS